MELSFQRAVVRRKWSSFGDIGEETMQRGFGLRSNEEYLKLFGLTVEEIFTCDVRRRIAAVARRIEIGEERKGKGAASTYSFIHVMELRKQRYRRGKQKRKDKK